MSLKYTRLGFLHAATSRPWTTDLRHLLPVPKRWKKAIDPRERRIKSVRPADRITFWNIVPGDQIRLLGDKQNHVHEVMSINRVSNRVFVRSPDNTQERDSDELPASKNYHYSRCQLFIGDYEFPPGAGSSEPKIFPVFAKRVGASSPYWNPFFHRYEWKRYAIKSTPDIPGTVKQKIEIPWPPPQKKSPVEPGLYDTSKDEVAKVTYKFPNLTPSLNGLQPREAIEDEYLTSLYNPQKGFEVDETIPVEMFMFRELSNPYSRAKKMKRWKGFQFRKRALLKEIMANEMQSLGSRTIKDAKVEAMFKWQMTLKEQQDTERKKRWSARNTEAELSRKNLRRKRKEAKQKQRLTELTLKEEPNQFIP